MRRPDRGPLLRRIPPAVIRYMGIGLPVDIPGPFPDSAAIRHASGILVDAPSVRRGCPCDRLDFGQLYSLPDCRVYIGSACENQALLRLGMAGDVAGNAAKFNQQGDCNFILFRTVIGTIPDGMCSIIVNIGSGSVPVAGRAPAMKPAGVALFVDNNVEHLSITGETVRISCVYRVNSRSIATILSSVP